MPPSSQLTLQEKWGIAIAFIIIIVTFAVYVIYVRYMRRLHAVAQLNDSYNTNGYGNFAGSDEYSDHNFHNYINGNRNDDEDMQFFPTIEQVQQPRSSSTERSKNTNVHAKRDNNRRLIHILSEMGYSDKVCEEAVEESANLDEALDYCMAKMNSMNNGDDDALSPAQKESRKEEIGFLLYNPFDILPKKNTKSSRNRQIGDYEMLPYADGSTGSGVGHGVLNPMNEINEHGNLSLDQPRETKIIRKHSIKQQYSSSTIAKSSPSGPSSKIPAPSIRIEKTDVNRYFDDQINYSNDSSSNATSGSNKNTGNGLYSTPPTAKSSSNFSKSSSSPLPAVSISSNNTPDTSRQESDVYQSSLSPLTSSEIQLGSPLGGSPFSNIDVFSNNDDDYIDAKTIRKAGYLKKLSSGISRTWAKRWFFIYGGKLYYTHKESQMNVKCDISRDKKSDSTIEQTANDRVNISKAVQVANLLISTVKEVSKVEFQIISPGERRANSAMVSGGVYDLQGDDERDVADWISTIRQQISASLSASPVAASPVAADHAASHGSPLDSISSNSVKSLLFVPSYGMIKSLNQINRNCVDCNASNPDWASLNLCVMVCIECSGIHRSLGSHVSKVRSLSLDMWTQCQIQLLQFIGNDKANMIWESSILDSSSSSLKYRELKPMAHSSHEVKENFILSKYIKKLYVGSFPSPLNSKTKISAGSKPPTLFMCVKARNIYDVMRCLVHDEGVVVNAKSKADNDSTALHIAVDCNFIELVELLCLWQADLNALDGDNQKPIDIAKRHNNHQVISTLLLYST